MTSILFHGTRARTPIEQIDESRAGRGGSSAEHGRGFYTRPVAQSPHVGHAHGWDSVRDNAGWTSGDGGIVYGIEIPEHFDGYSKKHQERFLMNTVDVDQALVDRLTTSMRKMGVDKETGRDFSAAADELQARFKKGHLNDWSTKQLVKSMQSEFGVDDGKTPGNTSTDIFRTAGIVGMYSGNNDSVVIFDTKALPHPKPYAAEFPKNKDANNVGKLLETISESKDIPKNLDGPLRKMALEAALDTEAGRPDAYQKVDSIRGMMEAAGVKLSPEMKKTFADAEASAGKVAGLSSEQIDLNRKAQILVDNRPPRADGEGFHSYHKRVYDWYDKNNPNPTPEQNIAFNRSLHNTWYREAQHHYADATGDALAIKNDPAKVERLLQQEPATETRNLNSIAHIEQDAGRYESTDAFKAKGSRMPHMKGAVIGIVGGLAAGGAAAAQPNATRSSVTDAVVDSAIPGFSAAKKGDTCRAFGEVVGSVAGGAAMVGTAVPAATAAAGVTAASGPAAPLVGPLAAGGAVTVVGAAGVAAEAAVAPVAEAACNVAAQLYNRAKSSFGMRP